jgi:hypothetical protein
VRPRKSSPRATARASSTSTRSPGSSPRRPPGTLPEIPPPPGPGSRRPAGRSRASTRHWTRLTWSGRTPADRAEGFAAERGALALHFNDYLYPGAPWYDGDGNATYSIWHQQPWWLTGFAWLGGLLAAALGWLLTGWMSRRPGAGHGRGPAAGSGPRQRYARRGRRRAREATPLDRRDGRRPVGR